MMYFLALATGHFVADFLLQSGFTEERRGLLLARHLFVIMTTVTVCLYGIELWTGAGLTVVVIGISAGFVAVTHVAQDIAVARIQKRPKRRPSDFALLVGDQSLHLLLLGGVALILSRSHIASPVLSVSTRGVHMPYTLFGSTLLLTLGTAVAAVFLAHMLAPFKKLVHTDCKEATLPNAGLWIGLCERLLLIIAIASGSEIFSSVGLVMGAKSIFRFRELDKRANAEYYLLGSLVSICVAVAVGIGLRWLGTIGLGGSFV